MPKRKPFLVTFAVIIEASDEERAGDVPAHEKEINRLEDLLRGAPGPRSAEAGWQSTQLVELDPARVNCGRCARCGAWVSDREAPEPLRGLVEGTRLGGALLCVDCLPGAGPQGA